MNTGLLIFIIVIVVFALGGMLRLIPYVKLRRTAKASGVQISIRRLMGMKLRKTNPSALVSMLIKAKKADVAVTPDMLETLVLSRGHAGSVVNALIAAQSAGVPLEFRLAAAIDMSGGNPAEFLDRLSPGGKPYTEQALREAAQEYIKSLGDLAAAKSMS